MNTARAKRMIRSVGRGFSMVELMVALALGSIVVLAAISLFTTNQRTFQLQQGITDVQQQGRFVLDYMGQDLRRLGYTEPGLAVPGGADLGLVLADVNIGGINYIRSQDGGGVANDRLTTSYFGTVDCEGDISPDADAVPGPDTVFVVNTYWVDGNRQLMCMGSIDPATSGIALVTEVDAFQVLVGIDLTANNLLVAEQYRRIDQLGATDPPASIKLGILLSADAPVGNLPQQPRNFLVLDQTLTGGTAPLLENDVRRLFTTTITVRNYDPSQI